MDLAAELDRRRDNLGLVCPSCHMPHLSSASTGYDCGDCTTHYPMVGGYPDLIVGERFDDASDDTLLAYEERSNEDLTRNYWQPLFRNLWKQDRTREPRLLSVGCGTGVDVDLL